MAEQHADAVRSLSDATRCAHPQMHSAHDDEDMMANNIGMAAHLAGQSLRFGWYLALNRLVDRRTDELAGKREASRPARPVPSLRELLADQMQLLLSDAMAVREGLYPPTEDESEGPIRHIARVRRMFQDLPNAVSRRSTGDASSAQREAGGADVPDYYLQDFHFQTGGYLGDLSAKLYDVQVETLFVGAAAPMRRSALRPIARFMFGRDQRAITMLDVACGTGRFLRQVRLAYPAMRLQGLDLSHSYLEEARRHMGTLRPAHFIEAAAERMPIEDASVDILSCIFLFHELPPEVRRKVTTEFARVLKPGGLLVFIDSLQMGDKPGWDGLLESFPKRFHEPYYRHYAIDDLEGMFRQAGLRVEEVMLPFLSKMIACRKDEGGISA